MASNGATEADVLIVGSGPGGSAAAYHLARHGVDVLMVDRAGFPREKVCGDGLTPRGVRAMIDMGIDPDDPGFTRADGLRVYRDDRLVLSLPWPELSSFPNVGVVRTRLDFDHLLVQQAGKAGARLWERTEAVDPIEDSSGWVTGATVRRLNGEAKPKPQDVRARFVLAADGAASRFGARAGVKRDASRPIGIAARRYYRTTRDVGPWLESWLDLWENGEMLPGYGWIFPVSEGVVNVGAGLLNTYKGFKNVSAKRVFDIFVSMLPEDWRIGEETAEGPLLSGPIPMGMNRTPLATPGMLLIGDAGGLVNPFNGEGIAYAMESGELAAELVHDALASNRPGLAQTYPVLLRERYGRYFHLGRKFVGAIGNPAVMHFATKHGLHREWLMKFAMRVLANLTDGRKGDARDKLMYAMERMAPAS
ncbi:MAG: geranylgeranyl reductase family protein [Actinomycetota bacterium]